SPPAGSSSTLSPASLGFDTVVTLVLDEAGGVALHALASHKAATTAGVGSAAGSAAAVSPHCLSKWTLTSKKRRLSDASPDTCHGEVPDTWPSRWTEASVDNPLRRSTPADRSRVNANGFHSTSASK